MEVRRWPGSTTRLLSKQVIRQALRQAPRRVAWRSAREATRRSAREATKQAPGSRRWWESLPISAAGSSGGRGSWPGSRRRRAARRRQRREAHRSSPGPRVNSPVASRQAATRLPAIGPFAPPVRAARRLAPPVRAARRLAPPVRAACRLAPPVRAALPHGRARRRRRRRRAAGLPHDRPLMLRAATRDPRRRPATAPTATKAHDRVAVAAIHRVSIESSVGGCGRSHRCS